MDALTRTKWCSAQRQLHLCMDDPCNSELDIGQSGTRRVRRERSRVTLSEAMEVLDLGERVDVTQVQLCDRDGLVADSC